MTTNSSVNGQQASSVPNGITAVIVEGFKSLVERQVIEVRPLTILAGANSSGKSSAIQPLLLLKQTLDAPYDPGSLALHGPNVWFTSAEQFLSRVTPKETVNRFSVGFEANGILAFLALSRASSRRY